jgi:hypothetical protein
MAYKFYDKSFPHLIKPGPFNLGGKLQLLARSRKKIGFTCWLRWPYGA